MNYNFVSYTMFKKSHLHVANDFWSLNMECVCVCIYIYITVLNNNNNFWMCLIVYKNTKKNWISKNILKYYLDNPL